MTTELIALDWGTTALRAYWMDDVSRVTAERHRPYGILRLPEGGFEAALREACGDWLDASPGTPVIACGMVGARQGWVEAPYVACPVGLPELAGQLAEARLANGRVVHIVPGLSIEPDNDVPDVLRGEETQVFGALGPSDVATVILPGTHSKWIGVSGGRIESFATFMTGELYDLLRTHSILATMMEGDADDHAAYERGVKAGVDGFAADGVLHHLFGVRSLALFGRLSPTATAAYLSGLLIGAEIGGATRGGRVIGGARLMVLGEQSLADRYLDALAWLGLDAEPGPPSSAAAGLFRIAGLAGLLD